MTVDNLSPVIQLVSEQLHAREPDRFSLSVLLLDILYQSYEPSGPLLLALFPVSVA